MGSQCFVSRVRTSWMLWKILGLKRLIYASVSGSEAMWSKVWPREVVPAASRGIGGLVVEMC